MSQNPSNLERFKLANAQSPVVAGSAKGTGGQGAIYVLADGTSFDLSAEECAALTGGPRWDLPS
jgi:hypothetical protein